MKVIIYPTTPKSINMTYSLEMDKMTKSIIVDSETHKNLSILKAQLGYLSMDMLIKNMLQKFKEETRLDDKNISSTSE